MPVDRAVSFSTVFNFRDLGGQPTGDGRTVRRGRLYRSDALFRLSGDDLAAFAALGVRTVVDLRRADERATDPALPAADRIHHIDLQVQPWPVVSVEPAAMARYLADRYADLAEAGLAGDVPMGRALRMLVDTDAAPLVFHCAAGKDRTGVLAALVLDLLGVDDERIADDYALSAAAEWRAFEWHRGVDPDFEPWPWLGHAAPREAILLFLADLRQRHGSVARYVERAGFDAGHVATLREHLL